MSFSDRFPFGGVGTGRAPSPRDLLFVLLTSLSLAASPLVAQDHRVYLRIADPAGGSVADVSARVETAIQDAGWTVLSSHAVGVDRESCTFGAQVLVADWPEYTRAVMSQGIHGAFAAPLRISVYEDELGVHVAAINPRSLNRTMVAEEGMDEDWDRFAQELRETVASGMGEEPVAGEFGQKRDKGRIGRTMGIMAGGPFREKIKEVETVPGGERGAMGVAHDLFQALQAKPAGEDWGIRPVYLMPVSEDVVVLGFTGERMESRSFSIVGKGGDKKRSDFACPGLDHSAAYPVGVVVAQEGDQVRITLVDEMFRMKMFFEDAGKMSFARNMTMPGSIEDEIKNLIRGALF